MESVSLCREFHKLSEAWSFRPRRLLVTEIFGLEVTVVGTCVFVDSVVLLQRCAKMLGRNFVF